MGKNYKGGRIYTMRRKSFSIILPVLIIVLLVLAPLQSLLAPRPIVFDLSPPVVAAALTLVAAIAVVGFFRPLNKLIAWFAPAVSGRCLSGIRSHTPIKSLMRHSTVKRLTSVFAGPLIYAGHLFLIRSHAPITNPRGDTNYSYPTGRPLRRLTFHYILC